MLEISCRLSLVGCILAGIPCSAAPPSSTTTDVLREGRFTLDPEGRAIDGQVVSDDTLDRSIVAILPDRTTGEDWGLPHLARAIDDLNLLRPDAVFCVGDLVQGYTRDLETWNAEVDDYLAQVNRLDADFWPTAGNHDVISGDRDSTDTRFVDRYRSRFGPLHYAVRLEHGLVVVLFSDETLDGGRIEISDEQVTWLEGVLGTADPDRPIVLLMHRPLWRYRNVGWFERVHPKLVEAGVDAVVAGHFHALHRDDDRDGIQYHLLGVCGGAIDQHPLTGQFNHLTLLDLGPGDDIHIRHLPSGVVLPDDFVTRQDQDRAYRLKSGRVATLSGTLADPRHGPMRGEVTLRLRNPIDVPIEVSVRPASAPEPWLVPGHAFIARTAHDIANPSTTDLDSPFTLTPAGEIVIEPGASAEVPLTFTSPGADGPPPPPEVRVTVEYEDSQGRRVPIVLPRRVAVDRDDQDPADGDPAWPISAWTHSVYEEREPLGSLRTTVDSIDGRRRLALELTIFDDLLVDDDLPPEETVRTRANPHGDLVVIDLRTTDGPVSFLLEPGLSDPTDSPATLLHEFRSQPGTTEATVVPHAGLVVHSIPADSTEPPSHRFRILLPAAFESISSLQVRVADNDRTYHTQWRSLAPSNGRLRLGRPGGRVAP